MLKDFLKKFLKSDSKKHLYALVLAGGGGTRLWPKSRENSPKQFLPLFDKQTLTQITLHRLSKILPWEKIFVVTVSEIYKKEIIKEVPEVLPSNIFVEPARRDTGPAHGLGALYIHKLDPDAVIMTEAADRLVKPVEKYLETLEVAADIAYSDKVLIAMGVKPRYAHPGLGYIRRGEKVKSDKGVNAFKLEEFVEKPSQELADKYVASDNYFWNAGQYVWRADTLLESLSRYAPENLPEIREN